VATETRCKWGRGLVLPAARPFRLVANDDPAERKPVTRLLAQGLLTSPLRASTPDTVVEMNSRP
jgi:hypothetical protein